MFDQLRGNPNSGGIPTQGQSQTNITFKEKGLIIPLYKAIFRPNLECLETVSREGHRHPLKITKESN